MKYSFILFCAFLFFQFTAIAQSNYQRGLVVTLAGDTLKGFIDYKEWNASPKFFNFKLTREDQEANEFSPANSRYFEITGMEAYQQYAGRISLGATDLNRIGPMADTATALATIFLKVEQAGKNVILLSYTDQIKTRYFIQENDWEKPQELIFRPYLDVNNNVNSNTIFRNQLWMSALKYEVGSSKLQKEVESASYTLSDIRVIINRINGIGKKEQKEKQNNNSARVRFYAGAALNYTMFTVKGEHLLAESSNSKASFSPKLATGLDLFFNPNVRRFAFRTELAYTTTSINMYFEAADGDRYVKYSQLFDARILTVSPQFIYHIYNKERFKINIGGGLALNIPFYRNVKQQRVERFSPIITTTNEEKDNLEFASVYYTFPVRAGFVLNKRFEASVIYYMPHPLTSYVYYSFNSSSVQVGISYLFNKKIR